MHPRPGDDDATAARDPRSDQDADGGIAGALSYQYDEPSFQSLRDAHWHGDWGSRPFPTALDPFTCNRFEIAEFGREALALGVRYLGVCCGAGPHHIRALAEAVGKSPPASKYSADMSKHAFLGSHERLKKVQKDYANKL